MDEAKTQHADPTLRTGMSAPSPFPSTDTARIAHALERLDMATMSVVDRAERLFNRIDTVLAPVDPGSTSEVEPQPMASELATRLIGVSQRLEAISRRIDAAGDRVEL